MYQFESEDLDRPRFLTADDQVGFGRLLGLRDLVHQVLHVARQDDIADTHRDDFQTQVAGTLADLLFELASDGIDR